MRWNRFFLKRLRCKFVSSLRFCVVKKGCNIIGSLMLQPFFAVIPGAQAQGPLAAELFFSGAVFLIIKGKPLKKMSQELVSTLLIVLMANSSEK